MSESKLGAILKRLREAKFPSPSALAREMNIQASQVTRVEEGETEFPRVDLLAKFCVALEVSPNEVMTQAGLVHALEHEPDNVEHHQMVAAALRRVRAAQEELNQASVQLSALLEHDSFRPPGFTEAPDSGEKVLSLIAKMKAREQAHADGSIRDLPAAARDLKPSKAKPTKDEPRA